MTYSILADIAVEARPPASELSGYQAREALDEGLTKNGRELRIKEAQPYIPALLDTPVPDGESTMIVAKPGRRRDALRADWGLIESTETMPGGVIL